MKLLRLGKLVYTVYATYDEEGNECPVMEVLSDLSRNNNAAKTMLNKLRNYIPERGPDFSNKDLVKKLKGVRDIAEFRQQPKAGPKIRVLFFLDGENTVICTNAFAKSGQATPSAQIDIATQTKERYFEAKRLNQLMYETIGRHDD